MLGKERAPKLEARLREKAKAHGLSGVGLQSLRKFLNLGANFPRYLVSVLANNRKMVAG